MQFERIANVDLIAMPIEYQERIRSLSNAPIDFPVDDPLTADATIERIADADAVLTSWRTSISAEVIKACPNVKYIGRAASKSTDPNKSNIDLAVANQHNVTVTTLGQYGDEAAAEWIFGQMLAIATHNHELRWASDRRELFGKTMGIIGLGHMGSQVAKRAKALDMNVVYTSRTEKPWADDLGYMCLSLPELLKTSDVVSLHVRDGVQILGKSEFDLLKPGVMLINTSIGSEFDIDAFGAWVAKKSGIVFADKDVDKQQAAIMRRADNAWISDQSAGDSHEMYERLAQQLIENMQAFLAGSPIRLQPYGA